ncbi:MAG TPA: cohesin domain-containing protein, partial [Anaerolineae bacterium]|nr:cohesin domain-containing protein [Anaerolineae bacterium]
MTLTTQSSSRYWTALECVALLLLHTATTRAQSAALVHLVPAAATVGEGTTTAIQMRIENVEGLYGLDIRLKFDPAAVQVVDADASSEGLQTRGGDLLKPDFVVRNLADNEAGTVWFALTQLNPSEAVTGSGVVFTVTFRGVVAGASSPLSITYQKLASRSGDLIPASVEDGEIRVVAAQEAPPTPTVVPTAPPATLTATSQPRPTALPAATATLGPPPTAASTSTSVTAPTVVAKGTATAPATSVPVVPTATVPASTAAAATAIPPAPSATASTAGPITIVAATSAPAAPTETPTEPAGRG